MKSSKTKVISTLRMLSLDMLNNAGIYRFQDVIDDAPIFYSLFTKGLIYNIDDIKWINRDRFICADNNDSALLYSSLYMAGYPISIDDLKKFNQKDSKLSYEINCKNVLGIDMSISKPDDAIANAVGIAIAERFYESLVNNKNAQVLNYNTYVLCNIDTLVNGISHEALSIAGAQNLNKLVIICKYNKAKVSTKNIYISDLTGQFESYGFDILKCNSENISSIENALDSSHNNKKPIIIMVDISKNKNENLIKLSKECTDISKKLDVLRKELEVCSIPFEVLKDDRDYMIERAKKQSSEEYEIWKKVYSEYNKNSTKEQFDILEKIETGADDILFDSQKFKISDTYNEELVKSNQSVLNILAKKYFNLVNIYNNDMTIIDKKDNLNTDNPHGTNLNFNNRCLTMGGIMNGLARENIKVVGATDLVNSGVMLPSIKMSAYMNLPVTYLFTNDTVFNNLENNCNVPISELNNLRMIPNLKVFRPADVNEIFGTWEYILKYRVPACIVLGNEKSPKLGNTNSKYVSYGAYMIRKEKEHLDGVLIASGSEVKVALEMAHKLSNEGIEIRVVSMPSIELFEHQDEKYEKLLLPKNVPIMVLEPSSSIIWNRFATNKECIFGINDYSIPGNIEDVANKYDYLYRDIMIKIQKIVKK